MPAFIHSEIMIPSIIFLLPVILFAQCTSAQVSSSISESTIPSSSVTARTESSYSSIGIPLATSNPASQNATITFSTTTEDVTAIVGLSPSTTANATTSATPRPSNTRPCNGHVEFCDRKFSNISMVVAHNSPFVKAHNAASNQLYPVTNQLNDGIRGRKS